MGVGVGVGRGGWGWEGGGGGGGWPKIGGLIRSYNLNLQTTTFTLLSTLIFKGLVYQKYGK